MSLLDSPPSRPFHADWLDDILTIARISPLARQRLDIELRTEPAPRIAQVATDGGEWLAWGTFRLEPPTQILALSLPWPLDLLATSAGAYTPNTASRSLLLSIGQQGRPDPTIITQCFSPLGATVCRPSESSHVRLDCGKLTIRIAFSQPVDSWLLLYGRRTDD